MKGRREKDAASFELHPAWELLSDTYEDDLQRYAAAMPGVCAAGLNNPDGAALFEKEPLAPPLLRVSPAQRCDRHTLYGEIRSADHGHAALPVPLPVPTSPAASSC